MAGAPTPDPFTDRQLQAIARLVDREVTRRLNARFASGERHRDIRLAKTVSVDDEYPTTGNTFAIRFLDCAFTPLTPGSSTITQVERTAEGDTDDASDVIARDICGILPPEGAIVFAMWQRGISGDPDTYGEWWTFCPLNWIEFKLTEALTTADASATAKVVSGYGFGLPAVDTDVTVLNLETHTDDTYMFAGSVNWKGLAVHKGGLVYQTFQLECPPT